MNEFWISLWTMIGAFFFVTYLMCVLICLLVTTVQRAMKQVTTDLDEFSGWRLNVLLIVVSFLKPFVLGGLFFIGCYMCLLDYFRRLENLPPLKKIPI